MIYLQQPKHHLKLTLEEHFVIIASCLHCTLLTNCAANGLVAVQLIDTKREQQLLVLCLHIVVKTSK